MEQQLQGKTIPWHHVKPYLEINKRIINFEELIKSGDMTVSEVEPKLPKPLF